MIISLCEKGKLPNDVSPSILLRDNIAENIIEEKDVIADGYYYPREKFVKIGVNMFIEFLNDMIKVIKIYNLVPHKRGQYRRYIDTSFVEFEKLEHINFIDLDELGKNIYIFRFIRKIAIEELRGNLISDIIKVLKTDERFTENIDKYYELIISLKG